MFAAGIVGWRQTGIQKRQTDLQALALRSELFDRRYTVFERTEKFIAVIVRDADFPDVETERQFFIAIGEAKFLFGANVIHALDEIWKEAFSYRSLKRIMRNSYESNGDYGSDNVDKEYNYNIWFMNRLKTLPDVFDELKLGGKLV